MEGNPNRAEAERLLGIAEKLLQSRDLTGSRDFAILAQETEPLLEGSDQILAVADVLLAAEKRINNHHDWYAILQLDRRSDDQDLIKKQYRRLALLLHPDKNKFPLADQAFKLVADAWAVFNDRSKKSLYDNELSLFSKVDLAAQQSKLPVRRNQHPSEKRGQQNRESPEDQRLRLSSFWTMCPYCYNLYEYPRVYEGCCLRCQNCRRGFHAVLIPSLPPQVPGQEAYYCCWGSFRWASLSEIRPMFRKAPPRLKRGFRIGCRRCFTKRRRTRVVGTVRHRRWRSRKTFRLWDSPEEERKAPEASSASLIGSFGIFFFDGNDTKSANSEKGVIEISGWV